MKKTTNKHTKKTDLSVNLFGITLTSKQKEGLLKTLDQQLRLPTSNQLTTIATINPEQVIQAQTDDVFRHNMSYFSIAVADGIGIIWALKRLKNTHIERIPGVDLAEALVSIAVDTQSKVLLIGGKDTTCVKAAEHLVNQFALSSDQIRATSGYTNVQSPKKAEEEALIQLITDYKPSVVLVAFGAPYQEKWIIDHQELLQKNKTRVAMVVGGSFDYWAGNVSRAPGFVRKLGLEWLYRLITQPWRWQRQLRLIKFVWMVLTTKKS